VILVVNRIKGFLTNNYFENAEITKVEFFLLIAVILIFVPFVYSDLDDRFDRYFGDFEPVKKEIIDDKVTIGEFSISKTKYDVINGTITEWREDKDLDQISGTKMDEAIYNHLKSPEYQIKIYAVFVITMTALIVTVILSRKGYTSYTPWLEKLANDKLTFDLQLYQHIEMRRLKEFYRNTFKVSNEVAIIEDKQVVGWKPVDENAKWYSVFSEKLDYRLYELAFEKLWAEWCEDNYNIHRNADGEYEPKYNRRRQLYENPELVPNMSNWEIKGELEKKKVDIKSELKKKIVKIEKLIEFTDQIKTKYSTNDEEEEFRNLSRINQELEPVNEQIEETNYQKRKLKEQIKRFEKLKGVLEKSKPEEVYILNEKLSKIIKELGGIHVQSMKDCYEIGIEIGEYKDINKNLLNQIPEEVHNFRDKLSNTETEIQNLNRQLVRQNNETLELIDEVKYIEGLKGDAQAYTKAVKNLFAKVNEVRQKIDELNERYDGYNDPITRNTQKRLEEEKKESNKIIQRLKADIVKVLEKDIKEEEFKIRKLEARLDVMDDHNARDNETCLDIIMNQMNIFREGVKRDKIKKILIRKFQNDVLYYAVMINFRRGLQNATTKWLEADASLKRSEEEVIETQADQRDVASRDLEETVMSIIDDIQNQLRNDASKKNGSPNSTDSKNQESEVSKKIEQIQEKLTNRNNWETPEWRAMGSIYYKWREDGKEDKDQDDGKEKAELTFSEKKRKWINKYFRKITEESKSDPTEVAWEENRTVRAVHSLSKSFGFDESGGTGKAILFFGVVFALIIGTALTNSLDIVIETMQYPLVGDGYHTDFDFLKSNYSEYLYVIILLLCFFPLGILFYHQGVIFLSANASEELTLGNKPLIFVNFIVILIQGIIVYFLASSIGDVNAFLSLVMLLVFVDAVWVSIFTWNDLRDEVRDSPVYLEWIIFDIIIGLFAWAFSVYYASTPDPAAYGEGGWIFFLLLLIAFSTRAVVDYTYGWKNFWSKFADAE